MDIGHFIRDFVVVLLAGTVSGVICRLWSVSLLAGYLVVGALIGHGGLGLVGHPGHELELIAEAGALLLLFSVGIEFSIDDLVKLRRFFLVGGACQMILIAVPLTMVARWFGMSPAAALLAGTAGAFSSTILVFRALAEERQAASPHGRRALAVLLFQDAALIPLLLLVPLMTGDAPFPAWNDGLLLVGKTAAFILAVAILHRFMTELAAAWLASLRSVEIVVLITLALLGGLSWTAHRLELPPAIGAFAAGLVLSGNRLSKQIDAIILPFRETFAAVFFVTLGMLLQPSAVVSEPLLLAAGVVGMVILKTVGTAIALRLVGLSWQGAFGMALGLSQLGEFSFLLVSRGVNAGIISDLDYNRMLFIAVVTLVATPVMLRYGLKWAQSAGGTNGRRNVLSVSKATRAMVVGIGPIGAQVASRLETEGIEVTLVDLSPVNLHAFAQDGFTVHAGDARDPEVLASAGIVGCDLAVVCVPSDTVALDIVRTMRRVNASMPIVVRCRFQSISAKLIRSGATAVVSEEREAAGPLMEQCARFLGSGN